MIEKKNYRWPDIKYLKMDKLMLKGRLISQKFNQFEIYHYNFPEEKLITHSHIEAQIIVPLIGKTELEIDGVHYQLLPGNIGIVPPNTEHSFLSQDKHGERIVCYFLQSLWSKHIDSPINSGVYHLNPLIKELLFYLLLTPNSDHSNEIIKTMLLILKESLDLGKMQTINLQVDDKQIKLAIHAIEKSYNHKINFQELALKCGLSQRDFNRKFAKLVGITPKQLQTHFRIKNAKKLLRDKNKSVTDVAFMVGYQSVSQFIQYFRIETGRLPTEFKL
ncbi:MAG: helix-turn-helix domain-containing protein [Bacteriovorax sp.]